MARQKNMQRRRTILRNTFSLLRQDGLKNVSLQMIADKSEISKSLLQSYYPHKSKLMNEIVTSFMSTILKVVNSEEFENISIYAKMKLFIYILLELGEQDEGISRLLHNILKSGDSLEKWGQLLDNWLIEEGVKDELGNDHQIKIGLNFIVSGGGSIFVKHQELQVGPEEISNIMVKTFMSTFLDYPDVKTREALEQGNKIIENFDMDKVFEAINTMFSEK